MKSVQLELLELLCGLLLLPLISNVGGSRAPSLGLCSCLHSLGDLFQSCGFNYIVCSDDFQVSVSRTSGKDIQLLFWYLRGISKLTCPKSVLLVTPFSPTLTCFSHNGLYFFSTNSSISPVAEVKNLGAIPHAPLSPITYFQLGAKPAAFTSAQSCSALPPCPMHKWSTWLLPCSTTCICLCPF